MKTKLLALLCPVLMCSYLSKGQCKLDYSNYQLVLHEDFAEGITVNDLDDPNHPRGVWQFHHDEPEWGWGDAPSTHANPNTSGICNPADLGSYGEYYRKSQVSIIPDPNEPNDGVLRLTAERVENNCNTPTPVICKIYSHNGQPRYRYPNFVSGMIQLRRDVWSNPPQFCPHTFDAPISGATGWDGYTHGMFEIKMKIPGKADFPAFWLAGASQINIFEGKDSPREFMIGYNDWNSMGDGSQVRLYDETVDLAQDYHIYTCVWTPTQITFFFDGREIGTYDKDIMQLPNWADQTIIASHQVWYYAMGNGSAWEVGEQTHMDIDYIKVYKPINNDYSQPYKSDDNFVNHNEFEDHAGQVAAATKARSIAFNTQDPYQVFYAGTDGRLYNLIDANADQKWPTLNQIQMNHTPNFPPELIDGDLIFSSGTGKFLYRGQDGRIQYYLYTTNGWQHGYIDNNWGTAQFLVDEEEAVMAVSNANNTIFYKGTDDMIHYFAGGQGNAHAWIGHNYVANSTQNHYVKNDVVLQEVGNYTEVIYKGNDDRLQTFWIDLSQNPVAYVHGYIDNSGISTWKVKSEPGSVVMGGPGEVYYIGVDNKIQRYYNVGNGWVHHTIPYTYNSVGYWNGDYAREGITYDPNSGKVFYIGNDGRLQFFYEDGGNWHHGYADDYWTTSLYRSFGDQAQPNERPSLIFDEGTNRIHYLASFQSNRTFGDPNNPATYPEGPFNQTGYPKYFVWEPCELFNPGFGPRALNKNPLDPTEVNSLENKLSVISTDFVVYPNPSQDGVFNLEYNYEVTKIQIMDIKGAVVKEYNTATKQVDLSDAPNGLYIMSIYTNNGVQHQKLQVNR